MHACTACTPCSPSCPLRLPEPAPDTEHTPPAPPAVAPDAPLAKWEVAPRSAVRSWQAPLNMPAQPAGPTVRAGGHPCQHGSCMHAASALRPCVRLHTRGPGATGEALVALLCCGCCKPCLAPHRARCCLQTPARRRLPAPKSYSLPQLEAERMPTPSVAAPEPVAARNAWNSAMSSYSNNKMRAM